MFSICIKFLSTTRESFFFPFFVFVFQYILSLLSIQSTSKHSQKESPKSTEYESRVVEDYLIEIEQFVVVTAFLYCLQRLPFKKTVVIIGGTTQLGLVLKRKTHCNNIFPPKHHGNDRDVSSKLTGCCDNFV